MSVRVTFTVNEELTVTEVDEIIRQAFDGQPDGEAKIVVTGGHPAGGLIIKISRDTWEVSGR